MIPIITFERRWNGYGRRKRKIIEGNECPLMTFRHDANLAAGHLLWWIGFGCPIVSSRGRLGKTIFCDMHFLRFLNMDTLSILGAARFLSTPLWESCSWY